MVAEVRVLLLFIPKASPDLTPAFTPSLIRCFCPLASLRPATSLIAQCFTGQLKARIFAREVWVVSMVLTLGPALACRGVYSRKFKDQRPVLISTLKYGDS